MEHWSVYECFMRKAFARGAIHSEYCESHHVIPRSLGGSDHPDNLVDLTYREHFLAHWLLSKMFLDENRKKMAFAFHAMSITSKRRKITSWQFEVIKRCLKDQGIESRSKRQEYRRQLQIERVSKKHAGELLLIQKYLDGELTMPGDFVKLAKLKEKHSKPIRVIKGKHIRDKIAELLCGREKQGGPISYRSGRDSALSHEKRLEAWKSKR